MGMPSDPVTTTFVEARLDFAGERASTGGRDARWYWGRRGPIDTLLSGHLKTRGMAVEGLIP